MITKAELIAFLNEFDENYEVCCQSEDGRVLEITSLEWANGPWIIVEANPAKDDA